MNGLSDVRLLLRDQELQAYDAQGQTLRAAPPCLGFWGLMRHRFITRRALLALDADQLRDVGLSPRQAREEGLKAFWRE
ncbi:hypothetical protein PMM47T1_06031 [Pseudomonas sp. M47T1]|uniref:DUF1127 domain-containing protein n=1 Tax=unclassified Pseudomonas TaxID=196821 RepID=UPI0002607837|nr:DUF1127 domain-containing protein [Pseudomonas sp. M47T1]EIK97319.1 hypothetical protein PMM47T1_06031 [Pseudomonas sp. M47T1]